MNPPVVAEVKGGGFMVASKSVEGAWRFVDGRSCSCPAGMRRSCRHRDLVDAFLRERSVRRPSAPAHVSALVD